MSGPRGVAALAIGALALAALAFCGAAGADDVAPEQRERADAHFAEGKRLFSEGAFLEAAAEFEAANEIAPHPVVLANIGLCYEKAGKTLQALAVYRKFIANPDVSDAEADEIWARIDALEPTIGQLDITCEVMGCRVLVDGVEKGEAPFVLAVEPGVHLVEGDQEMVVLEPVEVAVSPGEVVSVRLEQMEVADDPEPQPEPPPPPPEDEPLLGVPFWVATGVTAAGGIGVIAFGARTVKIKDDYEKTDRLDDGLRGDGEKSRLGTNVMIGITAAAAAAATGFAIYDVVTADGEAADGADVAVAPTIGREIGLGLVGEF